MLNAADRIYEQHGLTLLRPSQLIAEFEELRNERLYQRERLAGTSFSNQRVSSDDGELAAAITLEQNGERRNQTQEQLNRYFANPERFSVRTVRNLNGILVALYVTDSCATGKLSVPMFRIASRIRETRIFGTLTRTLLSRMVLDANDSNRPVVTLTESQLFPIMAAALQASGFLLSGQCWTKIGVRQIGTVGELQGVLAGIAADDDEHSGIAEQMSAALGHAGNANTASELEHVLWPAKIRGSSIRTFVVPIKPRWATDLFDAGLARGVLWGAAEELALNPESVYYRAIKPRVLSSPARILWYVSDDTDIAGTKAIRACSRLTEVVIGPASEAFRRFRRFGVYQREDVVRTAGSPDADVMAVRFDDTELFRHRIGWDEMQSILQQHGVRNNFQSPVEIPEGAFEALYGRGMNG